MVKELLLSDYKRCGISKISFGILLNVFIFQPNPGLKFMTIFRLTQHYRRKNRLLFYFFFLWLRRLKVKYGFDISYRTQIGKGFYIGHFGTIVIHGDAVIGENCNISQGMTIGVSNYGEKAGVPTIGNYVFIGPNAGVFGNITIGNHVTIGANAVVTDSIADNQTVLPAKSIIIDKDLSPFYIHNTND
ncbi:serine acetyltransferase [Flavobacterium sp.]|uniref:serine acetyltransferase n=1 Tax=Flavobacterium sp. TaxID=239 RepID=UPI002FD9C196